jgi:3-oxoacyl-(acyl-carrier-protein) synthase
MLRHSFIAPTMNLDHIAPECQGISHGQSLLAVSSKTAIIFNTGLGGTNACLIFRKL